MKLVSKSAMLVTDLAKDSAFELSASDCRNNGHCKYCINGDNYSN